MPGLTMRQEMRLKMVKDMVRVYDEAMEAEGIPEPKRAAVRERVIWGGTQTQEKAPWDR
jgi:hypothetical protein